MSRRKMMIYTHKKPTRLTRSGWEYEEIVSEVFVMAEAEGWAMVRHKGCVPLRHKGCVPFVVSTHQLKPTTKVAPSE